VRKNFIYGREFVDGDVEAQLRRWLDHTANVRIHRTVKEQPIVRLSATSGHCCSLYPLDPTTCSS
jgi:hypothetical protein